ncbi:MAG: 1-(5-phosphoribosyl)-5-[(5-phosphoribosylamino)methylideneamino]imidazole-4-carboxamide isomerase [Methanoregulaceae archaeon]|jgi:phosphoribosylformimino-5-aminoimidazole carboxamide ribotide isomerase
MRVFPAVDILGGHCVQLVQGKKESATLYGDPRECAKRWIDIGADALHVINLDGAFGKSGKNANLVRDLIKNTGVEIELGGGIRSIDDGVRWLETGVSRIILSTMATQNPRSIQILADQFGSERVMAGVDAKGGQIAIEGWQKTAGDVLEWVDRFELLGVGSFLYTNVDVEGLQQGIRFEPVKQIVNKTRLPVVIAGGISSTQDIRMLKDIGAYGAVLGSALYSGKISLKAALEVCK